MFCPQHCIDGEREREIKEARIKQETRLSITFLSYVHKVIINYFVENNQTKSYNARNSTSNLN